jgi:hypothetical protein
VETADTSSVVTHFATKSDDVMDTTWRVVGDWLRWSRQYMHQQYFRLWKMMLSATDDALSGRLVQLAVEPFVFFALLCFALLCFEATTKRKRDDVEAIVRVLLKL